MKIKRLIGTCHEILAKSPFLVYLAAKIRNQTNRIIGSFFAENVDPCKNSELWLIRLTAPEASNFIDVGANIGNWTAAFLGLTPLGRGFHTRRLHHSSRIFRWSTIRGLSVDGYFFFAWAKRSSVRRLTLDRSI